MIKRILNVLLIIGVISIVFIGCNSQKVSLSNNITVNIGADKRVELMSVLQYLADFKLKSNYVDTTITSYTKDVDNYFAKYRDHEAVQLFESMSDEGFTYDIPFIFILNLSKDMDFTTQDMEKTFDNESIKRCGGITKIKTLQKALKEFYEETQFDAFFSNHQDYYNTLIPNDMVIKSLNLRIENMVDFYGYKQNSYNIILVPLQKNCWYGPRVQTAINKFDVYCIAPDTHQIATRIDFIIHEFSHSYVNYLADKFILDLNESRHMVQTHMDAGMTKSYADWLTIVNEYIVRANVIKLSVINSLTPEAKLSEAIEHEKSNGFIYIEDVYNRVNYYHNNRSDYESFEDYYSELITVFKDLEQRVEKVRFEGKLISLATQYPYYPYTIIVPTGEKTTRDNEYILNAAKMAKGTNSNDSVNIITDKIALKSDLTNSNIIAFGTFDGNLWIKENSAHFPFSISKNGIKADKEYKGTDLRLVTVFKHKDNVNAGVYIFSAQEAVNCITSFEKLTPYTEKDFVIFEGDKCIGSGLYDKNDTEWKFN